MAMLEKSDSKMRILELYSGIGGMHWALKESGVPFEVVMAVDINTTANQIYNHNFPDVNLNSFGIEKLSLKKLQLLRPDAILMSPPCQPFSRVGKKGDCDDVRTKSFLHVMQLLQQLDTKPNYILVENVKGFETSRTRQQLVDTLIACDFAYQEFMLNPLQFGIPNSRLRYYLIAKLKSCLPPLLETRGVLNTLPDMKTIFNPPSPSEGDQEFSESRHSLSSRNESHNSNLDCSSLKFSSHCRNASSDVDMDICKKHVEDSIAAKDLCQNLENSISHSSSSVSQKLCLSNNCTTKHIIGKDSCTYIGLQHGEISSHREDVDTETRPCFAENGKSPGGLTNNFKKTMPSMQSLNELIDAGRNMRFCEEADEMIDEESRPLSDYMEEREEENFQHLLVADKDLRQFVVMDIVLPVLKKSTCFTKRYGHYVEGAGSLVQMSSSVEDTHSASCFKSRVVELKNKHNWGEEEFSILRRLKLRYFSPREVANLMCFPKQFEFPEGVSNIQKYRVLGNSLNVHVVARLIRLFMNDGTG